VTAIDVIVVEVGSDETHEVLPAEDDDMVEQFAAEGSDPALGDGIRLRRRLRSIGPMRQDVFG